MSAPPVRAIALRPERSAPVRAETSTNELNEAAENYRRLGPLASDPVVLRETQRSLLSQLISMAEDPACTSEPPKGGEWDDARISRWRTLRKSVDRIIEELADGRGIPATGATTIDFSPDDNGPQYRVQNGRTTMTVEHAHVEMAAKTVRSEEDIDQLRKASDWLDNSIMTLRRFVSLCGIWTWRTPLTFNESGSRDLFERAKDAAAARVGPIGPGGPYSPDAIYPPPGLFRGSDQRALPAPRPVDYDDDDPENYAVPD